MSGKRKLMKKPLIKEKKIPIEDTILETLPSKTGSNNTTSETPKMKFTHLINELAAIKKNLEAHLNNNNQQASKILLNSVEKVVQIVDRYRQETKSQMPPFDWNRKEFLQNERRPVEISAPGGKSAKRSLTDSPQGHTLDFQNKEYWCLRSTSPDIELNICLTLGRLKRSVARETSTPCVVAQPPLIVLRFIPHLLDPNMNDLPLNVNENKIWLEFKEFDKGTPEGQVINVDKLDHPIVSVIGDFGVSIFNTACETHVKKGEHNNLHDSEFMECKYMKVTNGYCFYMTIEAIEEGNLGVYETEVVCSIDDGRRILSKFVLTNRTPVGTKAMAISYFSCVRSICKIVDAVTNLKLGKPNRILEVTQNEKRGIPYCERSRIRRHHQETMQGLQQVLYMDPPLLFPPDCKRTTNQDVWSHPDDYNYSRMVRRTKGTPCTGYDYINQKDIDTASICLKKIC